MVIDFHGVFWAIHGELIREIMPFYGRKIQVRELLSLTQMMGEHGKLLGFPAFFMVLVP